MTPTAKPRTESGPPGALRFLLLGVAVLALGCLDGGAAGGPAGPDDLLDPETLPAGLNISNPVPGPEDAVHDVTYVSAKPGTFPGAGSATLINLGMEPSVPVDISDGGFDPVPVAASAEDELEVLVLYGDGSSASYRSTVPSRTRPRIVRTLPASGAAEVPPNTSIVIVFSEPIDAATVTPETVWLLGEAAVASTFTLDDQGLRAKLLPRESLEPRTEYTLVVSAFHQIRDRSGDVLEEATVPFATGVAWEPDPTQRMAFATTDGIHVANADGSDLTRLTDGRYDADPAWSPDGSKIAFTRRNERGTRGIYTVNADGSALTRIAGPLPLSWPHGPEESGVNDPVWSPDGSRVAFWRAGDRTTWGVWVVEADGTEQARLSGTVIGAHPAWAPDGARIYYVSTLDLHGSWVAAVHMNGGEPSVIVDGLHGPWPEYSFLANPVPSPDGQKIAFQRGYARNGESLSELYVANADGSGIMHVTGADGGARDQECNPSWSPHGSMIAFWSARLGLAVTDDVGGKPRGLYGGGNPDLGDRERSAWCGSVPTWSPDGTSIAAALDDGAGGSRTYVVDVASGAARQLLPNWPGGTSDPAWAPAAVR